MSDRLIIAPDEIHLWLHFHEDLHSPVLLEDYRRLLSEQERERLSRFHFERDKHRFVVTRALVRVALSRYCEVAPENWRFSENAFGRPAIENRESIAARVRFNISHTDGLIVLAVTLDRELGVDAEHVGRGADCVALARHSFADEEAAELAALPAPEQPARFFDYWTLKESYVKALGKGLFVPLDRMRFRFAGEHGISTELALNAPSDGCDWRFWLLRPSAQHVVAVCAGSAAARDLRLSCRRSVPLRREEQVETQIARRSK